MANITEKDIDEMFDPETEIDWVNKAYEIIQDDLKRKVVKGRIKCPKCGKKLKYHMSLYNNHIHGHCEDENCLHWME